MRIGLISTLATTIRPGGGGSVESLVGLLAGEFVSLGHEVTVFAGEGSHVAGTLVATLPSPYGVEGAPGDWQVCEWINLCRAISHPAPLDVLHSHSYLFGLPLQRFARVPLINTMHLHGYDEYARIWRLFPEACVTALSAYQWSAHPELKPTAMIHHGVDPRHFTFRQATGDYLLYFGRFTAGKGPLHAISAARGLGQRLILAGPPNEYFRTRIEPLLDGREVEYVGPVSGAERDALLGGAKALLYPVAAPEPFGLVMIEAMMCGTPIAAMRVGAVSEIVDEGISGYSASAIDEFPEAVARALTLDRTVVRAQAEARFSSVRMAREYARLYERVVGDAS